MKRAAPPKRFHDRNAQAIDSEGSPSDPDEETLATVVGMARCTRRECVSNWRSSLGGFGAPPLVPAKEKPRWLLPGGRKGSTWNHDLSAGHTHLGHSDCAPSGSCCFATTFRFASARGRSIFLSCSCAAPANWSVRKN